jgi:hypothetical protein
VLCKRVDHVRILRDKLRERGENVCTLVGNEQTYDKDARILIGTYSKCGVGFDHVKLDSLFLCSDIVDFEQIHGRVFRKKGTIPLFIDLVDKFPTLKSHWYERKKLYEEMGGDIESYTIKKFKTNILDK